MATSGGLSPTEYIGHHLTFDARSIGDGGFWTLHVDTFAVSLLLGVIGFGLLRFARQLCCLSAHFVRSYIGAATGSDIENGTAA